MSDFLAAWRVTVHLGVSIYCFVQFWREKPVTPIAWLFLSLSL